MTTVNPELFVQIIIRDLNTPNVAPLGALMNAHHVKRELEPYLLADLEQAIEAVQRGQEPSTMSFYSIFLLNEFRTPGLYPLLLRILRLSESQADALMGDALIESMGRIIAANFSGTAEDLWAIFDDKNLYAYARYAALRGLLILFLHNKIMHDVAAPQVSSRLTKRMKELDIEDVTELVELIMQTRMSPLYDLARQAFKQDLVDFYATQEDFEEDCVLPPNLDYDLYNYIDTAYEGIAGIFGMQRLPPIDLGGRLLIKIGRNDDCYCNSGKKYKKCCLANASSVQDMRFLDLVG